jgi:vancomycin resistance protein YoaR
MLVCSGLFLCKNASAATGISDICVRLRYQETEWVYRYPDIRYKSGIDKALDESFIKDFRGRLRLKKKDFACRYYLKDIDEKLRQIAEYIDCPPQDASVEFFPDVKQKFIVRKDVKGKKTDVDSLRKQIEKALGSGKSADIIIKPQAVEADITAGKIKNALYIRGEFSTDFSASPPERKHNIALSLKCFNGMVVAPGEEVSFNDTVGPRTTERGYKISKIISGGDFIEGYGGGVCQTSTTLYNALLLSDIAVTQYRRHSLAVSYVPPSFDAMVNISHADLKFKNNSGNYIFIKAWTEGGRAYVRIYGERLPYSIKRKSTVVKTYPAPKEKEVFDTEKKYNLHLGESVVIPSKPKIESIGELIYIDGEGRIIKTVLIRKDVYGEFVGKIIRGTQKKAEY